jgi:hypothetical protein
MDIKQIAPVVYRLSSTLQTTARAKNTVIQGLFHSLLNTVLGTIKTTNARRTGNWTRLISKAKSVGISDILGMSTSSPLNFPMNIVVSIKFFFNGESYSVAQFRVIQVS